MGRWLGSPLAILWLTFIVGLAILSRLRYRWRAAVAIVALGLAVLGGIYRITSIPLPEDISLPRAAVVYDRDGEVIGRYSDGYRIIVDSSELPPHVSQAVVAAEDRDFFTHGGFSPAAILRASLANLTAGRIVQGGSTITQQYVKNALLADPARTIVRKVKEAVLATKLEDRFGKSQILDFYLNTIYLGRGAYGIEAAARTYFNKPARALNLSEAALLAGIIRSPEGLRPDRNPAGAIDRRDHVLRVMVSEGYVTNDRARLAAARGLGLAPGIDRRAGKVKAAYFMEWLRRDYLAERFGDCLYRCGLHIHTTLDLDIQRHAEAAVTEHLDRSGDPQAALVAMTPKGHVLAFVGGREVSSVTAAAGFNFASDRPGRQAGSSLKPFTLSAALQDGMSTGSYLSGASPMTFQGPPCGTGKSWKVRNYGGASYGSLSLSAATASSVNTVYAQVAQRVGPDAIAKTLTRFGFRVPADEGAYCSLALGSLDVTPLEMARGYAGLAAGGYLPGVVAVTRVEDSEGGCLYILGRSDDECEERRPARRDRAVPAAISSDVSSVLRGVADYGTGTAASRVDVDVAVKTGTSQNNADAWFAGYSSELAAAVWVGYPAERGGELVPQMRSCRNRARCRPFDGADVTGGGLPADIWTQFMIRALAELGDGFVPPGTGDAPTVASDPVPLDPEVEAPPEPEEEVPVIEPAPAPSGGFVIVVPDPLP